LLDLIQHYQEKNYLYHTNVSHTIKSIGNSSKDIYSFHKEGGEVVYNGYNKNLKTCNTGYYKWYSSKRSDKSLRFKLNNLNMRSFSNYPLLKTPQKDIQYINKKIVSKDKDFVVRSKRVVFILLKEYSCF